MSQYTDPFDIVKSWWGNKPIIADTTRLKINLNSKQGAFECFILAILYSIEDPGQLAEGTFDALRKQDLTDIDLLSSISESSTEWQQIIKTFEQDYRGRQKNRKTEYITKGARLIAGDPQLRGDLRNLYPACKGNGDEMLNQLWKFIGLAKKTFWIMREMRMQGVWNIDGKYCCVPDKQVGSSLERWGKISGWKRNQGGLKSLLNCSAMVWQAFGELYDFPILEYARTFKCNDNRLRRCHLCSIVACSARTAGATPAKVTPAKHGADDKGRPTDKGSEILLAGRAIVEAKNNASWGTQNPNRELTINRGWASCLMCKGGPLDLSTVKTKYDACLSHQGKQPWWWIPVRLWIRDRNYDGKLRYATRSKDACITSPLKSQQGKPYKLGPLMTSAGFGAGDKVNLKFIENEVWVVRLQ